MNRHNELRLNRWLTLSVTLGIAIVIGAGCKRKMESSTKTLDNFAAGQRVSVNTCQGSTQQVKDPEVVRRVEALMKRVRPASIGNDIQAALRAGFAAVPISELDAFLTLHGEVHIVDDANGVCTKQLTQITDPAQAKQKQSELGAFKEGMAAVDHCYLYLPNLYSSIVKTPPPILVIKNDVDIVKHAVVRVFGFFLSSHLTHITFTKDGFTYSQAENAAFRQNHKAPLAKAFLNDIQNLHRDSISRFAPYQDLDHMDAPAREQFEDFVFAESYDSFHCNAFADSVQKNTLFSMMTNFPNSYAEFKKIYTPGETATTTHAGSINTATQKHSGGFGLASNGSSGSSWYGSVRDFGTGYASYFGQNARSAYNYTSRAVTNTATAAGNAYTGYSDGLKARTQTAIDGIANSNGGKIGLTGYAQAIVTSTGTYNAENAKNGYVNYSNRVANTTQGVIDTIESNKGTGNLNALDYTSAVLYATSAQGLGSMSGTVGASQKLAEAIGGGAYALDEEGNVTPQALTVNERLMKVGEAGTNALQDAAVGAAFTGASKINIMGGSRKLATEVAEEAVEAGGRVAVKDTGKIVSEAVEGMCLGGIACNLNPKVDLSRCARTPEGGYQIKLRDGTTSTKFYTSSEEYSLQNGYARIRGTDGEVVHYSPAKFSQGPEAEMGDKMKNLWNGNNTENLADSNFGLDYQAARARKNLEKSGQSFSDGEWQYLQDSVGRKAKEVVTADPAHKFAENEFESMLEDTTSGRIAYKSGLTSPKVNDEFKGGQWFDIEGPKANYRQGFDTTVFDESTAELLYDSSKTGG